MSSLSLTSLVLLGLSLSAQGFTYFGPEGVEHWDGACATGEAQSPINIVEAKALFKKEEPFQFKNYNNLPEEVALKNEGKTVKIEFHFKHENEASRVSGGGLPGTYEFAQAHFHWGDMEKYGSEHLINNGSFPMELHLVHFNTKYGSDIASAIANGGDHNDILAVLGVMLRMDSMPNKNLDPIVRGLKDINEPKSEGHIKLFGLQDLLPKSRDHFFRYNGSLTTPGCNEIVVWTVFKDSITISSEQMSEFRSLYAKNPVMKNNFRPVLPLHGRMVYEVQASGAASLGLSAIVSVFVVNLALSSF